MPNKLVHIVNSFFCWMFQACNTPKGSSLCFIVLFFGISLFYYPVSFFHSGPTSIHFWRQSDNISIAKNYYEGGMSFFQPEIHNQLCDDLNSGKTAFEFPIFYYAVAAIWKVFGESYFSFRFLYFLVLFLGLFSLFKMLRIILKDSFWATAISILVFTSPAYAFYAVSFIADGLAFSVMLVAAYMFTLYSIKQKLKLFYLSMALFALAGLVKISVIIPFVFLFGIYILECFGVKTLENRKLFLRPKLEWTGILMVVAPIVAWYAYVDYYNTLHEFSYSLSGIYPLWEISKAEYPQWIKGVKNFTLPLFFSRPVIFACFLLYVINLLWYKKVSRLVYLSSVVIPFGCMLYFVLWGKALNDHDYYYIALITFIPACFIPFLIYVKTNFQTIYVHNKTKIAFSLFLLFNIVYCYNIMQLRTTNKDRQYWIVGSHDLVESLKWTNFDLKTNWQRYTTIESYNRSIGIEKTDKVVSISDYTACYSLLMMNQKGWTALFTSRNPKRFRLYIERGAKYLFVGTVEGLQEEWLQEFMHTKIGEYKDIHIFQLQE